MGRLMVKSHVLPVVAGGFDLWTIDGDGTIGELTAISAGGGTFTALGYWKSNYGSQFVAYTLAPGAGSRMLVASRSGGGHLFMSRSSDNGATFDNVDEGASTNLGVMDSDRAAPDNIWYTPRVNGSGSKDVWYSTDGGATLTKVTIATGLTNSFAEWLGAAMGGAFAYIMIVNQDNGTPTWRTRFYKFLNDGTYTAKDFITTGSIDQPSGDMVQNGSAIDPTNPDRVYTVNADAQHLFTMDWGANTFSDQALPVSGGDVAAIVFCTVMGTVLVFVDNSLQSYILRSTDNGATWSNLPLSGLLTGNLFLQYCSVAETQGAVGVTPGTIVVGYPSFFTQFMFSTDDGLTWAMSGSIGYDNAGIFSLRARS